MTTMRCLAALVIALLGSPAPALAQKPPLDVYVGEPDGGKWVSLEVVEAAEFDAVPHVTGAPFFADAVTEFTQVLGDGNRIEKRYDSSVARDSRGRTRREEKIVFLGVLANTGPSPRLVTIVDPEANASYTLDERMRVAHRNQLAVLIVNDNKWKKTPASIARAEADTPAGFAKRLEADASQTKATTEALGRRSIEGVMAEGSRTTSIIPAGAIGNLQPIEIVSERWFSPELQMPVLITRRDPRVGDTVYRLLNVVRAEPPAHLFTVPPGYEIHEGKLGMWKKLESAKGADLMKKK